MKVCHITHLEQTHTNVVTPILDPAVPATRLLLLIDKSQREDAECLESMLSVRGIKVDYKVIDIYASSNTLIDHYLDIFSTELARDPDESVYFNGTCGNRRNSLLAYDVARNLEIPSYIIEPNGDALHWVYPTNQADTPLADKLKLRDFFHIHNMTVGDVNNTRGVHPAIRDIIEKWLQDLTFFGSALSTLNFLASSASETTLASKALSAKQLANPALLTLVDDLETLGKLTLTNNKLQFADEQARLFANGGWLEEYAFGVMVTLKRRLPALQDIAQGMEVERDLNGYHVKNELDVVALANNKLHVIECKTKKFVPGEGNEVIYKVDSITDFLGGSHARAMFISLKAIRLAERRRANELDITFIGPEQLPNITQHIENWLRDA